MTNDDELIPLRYIARSVAPTDDEWHAGEIFDGYEPVDPDARLRRRRSGRAWNADPHSIPLPPEVEHGRTVQRLVCMCGKVFVRVQSSESGERWAIIRPERISPAARRDGHPPDEPLAAPLHQRVDGLPHLEVSTCKCGQDWLVALYDDTVEQVQLRRVSHGLRVDGPDRT